MRFQYILPGDANSKPSHEFLHSIRDELIPQFLTPQGVEGNVSGNVPYVVDQSERYAERTPRVVGVVLVLSMVFLLLAFRSIAIPCKAVLLNLLSTVAAFGAMVAIFQWGIFGHWHFSVIEGFVPGLLFSILFGLSMDYHVLLLSRIQEEIHQGAATTQAVRIGIGSTFRTITGAALIMASVFVVAATLELPIMKQLGVGLAIAVLLDATVVRSLLLPASMVLLGQWNWYLPRWLRWLPQLKIG